MKIFVNARFLTQPLSGVQRYGIECSRQIKKLCNDLTFLCPQDIIHRDIADELGVKVIGKNNGHLWEQADLPFFLAKQKNPPLLNLANTAPLLYGNNYVTIHDLAFYHRPEWFSKKFAAWYNILIPRLAYKSRHLFTVSQTIRSEIVKCYNVSPAKISVTYNGISESMLLQGFQNQQSKEKIILSVGSFNKRKNHHQLIAAFLESDIKNDYQLVIVGDKNKVFSETGLDEESLMTNGNISIYQHFSEQELISMYQKAEIVASLSVYEGFGIPLLEGLYNGCKVLCSDIPVYREIYHNHATFCDPYSTNSISDALKTVAGSRTAYSGEDLAPLFEKYSYAAAAKTILDKISQGQ